MNGFAAAPADDRPQGRCLHQEVGSCPACRAFASSLTAAVGDLGRWKPGILGRLNRESEEARQAR